MALNKRRSLGSASSTSAAPVKTDAKTSEATDERGNGSDFTAIQTALEAIVNSIAELAKKIESAESTQAKLAERLDAIEAAMDEDGDDTEGVGEDEDEDEGEDVTPDDIDFEKVSTILHDMGDDEQKEVLSAAMKKLGVKRLRLPDLRKNPEQLFAVAEVLNEDYEVDVDNMLK